MESVVVEALLQLSACQGSHTGPGPVHGCNEQTLDPIQEAPEDRAKVLWSVTASHLAISSQNPKAPFLPATCIP